MDVKEPISLAEKIGRRTSPIAGLGASGARPGSAVEDGAEGYEAFKTGGDHRFEVMLTLRLKEGNFRAFGYSYLVELSFNPSKELVLEFTSEKVTITGRNLTPLFKALAAHKVVWVWEADHLTEPTEDAATVVNGIRFGKG